MIHRTHSPFFRLLLIAAFVSLVGYYLSVLVIYGGYPGYLDHGEPVIAAAAWKLLDGQPVYPPFDGPLFTSNAYGPILFAFNALSFAIFGGSVAASKIAGLLSAYVAVLLTGVAVARGSLLRGMAGAAFMAAIALLYTPYSFWNRPESMLCALVAAGLFVLCRSESQGSIRWHGSALALGILGGLAMGLKIYGAIFFFPLGLAYAFFHRSVVSVPVMAASGLATVMLPFAFSVFPLSGYLSWFQHVSEKPFSGDMFARTMRYGLFLILPLFAYLVVLRNKGRENSSAPDSDQRTAKVLGTVYGITCLLGIAVCMYLGTRPGAGDYYALPFAPLVADMIVRGTECVTRNGRRYFVCFAATLIAAAIVISVPIQQRFYRALEWNRIEAIQAELADVMQRYNTKSIQMGVGDSIAGYKNAIYKTSLVFAGHPYTIDFGIMMETSKMGIPVPRHFIDGFARCDTGVWLIPTGEFPFGIVGYYGNQVFSDEFREAFLNAYQLIDSAVFFDVWSCLGP
jgi:hypothetical protein